MERMERGEASLKIELADGRIKVYHGTDKLLLWEDWAPEGKWNQIWNAILNK